MKGEGWGQCQEEVTRSFLSLPVTIQKRKHCGSLTDKRNSKWLKGLIPNGSSQHPVLDMVVFAAREVTGQKAWALLH